jgi:hypothetical protein
MTTRYQKRHYEDVAGLLRATRRKFSGTGSTGEASGALSTLAYSFSILFTADNPPTCTYCGAKESDPHALRDECASHVFMTSFDRERFLAACGLDQQPEGATCARCGEKQSAGVHYPNVVNGPCPAALRGKP